jgi:hypothetical protein
MALKHKGLFLVSAMLTALLAFERVWVKVVDMAGYWPRKLFMARLAMIHGALIHADSQHMPILN